MQKELSMLSYTEWPDLLARPIRSSGCAGRGVGVGEQMQWRSCECFILLSVEEENTTMSCFCACVDIMWVFFLHRDRSFNRHSSQSIQNILGVFAIGSTVSLFAMSMSMWNSQKMNESWCLKQDDCLRSRKQIKTHQRLERTLFNQDLTKQGAHFRHILPSTQQRTNGQTVVKQQRCV